MKHYLSVLLVLFACSTQAQIISQYVETNSGASPKGIEIWNNTSSTLDFSTSNLVIKKGTNGAAPSADFTLSSGTLASGDVLVIGTPDIGTYMAANGVSSAFHAKSFTFNGDDALVVEYGTTVTDVFGQPGIDPGSSWSGNGVDTRNQNIELKTGITSGTTAGFSDPSTRFDVVSTNPVDTANGGLNGFGVSPSIIFAALGEAQLTAVSLVQAIELHWQVDLVSAYEISRTDQAGNTEVLYADVDAQSGSMIDENLLPGTYVYLLYQMKDGQKKVLASTLAHAEANALRISPNPATNVLNIYSDGLARGIEIYSAEGKKILQTMNVANQQKIDVSDLQSGYYIIKSGESSLRFYKR